MVAILTCVGGLAACAAEDPPTGPPMADPGTSGSGAGTPTGAAGGGMGAGGSAPETASCVGDVAFRADEMTFVDPTPAALADALNEHIGADDHPLTLVLRNGDGEATIGASFALETGNAYKFIPPLSPAFTAAAVEQSTFFTMAPATEAFARIRHDEGVLDPGLVDVDVDATTELDCGLATVTIEATIPASSRTETIVGSAGPLTLGELAGGSDTEDIPVTATFAGTSISFDFDSLD
jgi:hypothetical protein